MTQYANDVGKNKFADRWLKDSSFIKKNEIQLRKLEARNRFNFKCFVIHALALRYVSFFYGDRKLLLYKPLKLSLNERRSAWQVNLYKLHRTKFMLKYFSRWKNVRVIIRRLLIAGSKTIIWKLLESFCTFPITKFIATACGKRTKETESSRFLSRFRETSPRYKWTVRTRNRHLAETRISQFVRSHKIRLSITLNCPTRRCFRASSSRLDTSPWSKEDSIVTFFLL